MVGLLRSTGRPRRNHAFRVFPIPLSPVWRKTNTSGLTLTLIQEFGQRNDGFGWFAPREAEVLADGFEPAG